MTYLAKTFSVKRENKPGIHVTGFPGDNGSAFINLKVGDSFGGEFQIIWNMYVPDARALAIALENAINHADQSDPVAAARLDEVA